MGRTGEDAIQISTAQPCPHPGKPTAPPGGETAGFRPWNGTPVSPGNRPLPRICECRKPPRHAPTGAGPQLPSALEATSYAPACRPAGRALRRQLFPASRRGKLVGVELEFSLTKDTTCCIVLCEGGHLDDRSAAEARLAGFLCAGRTVPGESHGYKIVKDLSACIDISSLPCIPSSGGWRQTDA